MTALNDLKQALHDLQDQATRNQQSIEDRINAAVAAKEAEDDQAFNEAIGDVRALTQQLAAQTTVVHQTAAAIAPSDLPAAPVADAAPAATDAQTAPPVQTTQTATTDPTGTTAELSTVSNVPDGAMSTAAPGASVDPLTQAPVAQVPGDVVSSNATTADTATPAPVPADADEVPPAADTTVPTGRA
jgi:hypothetical protein